MTSRRKLIKTLAVGGATSMLTGGRPNQIPVKGSADTRRNVRSFGARGDGRADDTAAFNAATAADETWRDGLSSSIYVPPGTYRIDGTIFVRRGQEITGAGDATIIDASRARGRTLVLGRGTNGPDPGGAPASIAQLRFLGGSGSEPLIDVGLEGFALRDLFISATGTAIRVSGADGIVSNIIIDQALNGVVLRGARNVIINGLVSYLANYAVTIDRGTNDVILSDMILAYSRYASVLFPDDATGITSIRISNTTFVSSIGYPTFIGHVHARSAPFDAQFTGCVFRNWREHAIVQGSGSGADLSFSDCTFDGARSHPGYNASDSAKGLKTGVDGRFRLSNCRFRNLSGEVALIGPGLRELVMDGGAIERCSGDTIRVAAAPAGRMHIRNMDGFGRQADEGGTSSIALPWLGASTAWRVSASKRASPGGFASATIAVTEGGEMVTCVVEAAGSFGAAPALAAGFGPAPGGPSRISLGKGSGLICVSADRAGIDWSVETIS